MLTDANSQAAAPVITTPVTTTTGTPEQQQPASTGGGLFDKFVQVSQGGSKQQQSEVRNEMVQCVWVSIVAQPSGVIMGAQ